MCESLMSSLVSLTSGNPSRNSTSCRDWYEDGRGSLVLFMFLRRVDELLRDR